MDEDLEKRVMKELTVVTSVFSHRHKIVLFVLLTTSETLYYLENVSLNIGVKLPLKRGHGCQFQCHGLWEHVVDILLMISRRSPNTSCV